MEGPAHKAVNLPNMWLGMAEHRITPFPYIRATEDTLQRLTGAKMKEKERKREVKENQRQ